MPEEEEDDIHRGNACTPGVKLHNTSWADPEWRFSTGKAGWIAGFSRMTQAFLTLPTELARAGATLWSWGKLSTSPDPSLRQESNSLSLRKHNHCYCDPLPLGNHPHPSEDRAAPGKKNSSPAGAWTHSSLPELLAICSQYSCTVKGQRSKRGQGWCEAEQLRVTHNCWVWAQGRTSPPCLKVHAVNCSWMLLIRNQNELLQQQLKQLTCKMWELMTSLKSCRCAGRLRRSQISFSFWSWLGLGRHKWVTIRGTAAFT